MHDGWYESFCQAAVLHDVLDKKYVSPEVAANPYAFFRPYFTTWATTSGIDLNADGRGLNIAHIIDNISWTTEKRLRESGEWTEWHDSCIELHCVQDADRLDAIGAFGTWQVVFFFIIYQELTLLIWLLPLPPPTPKISQVSCAALHIVQWQTGKLCICWASVNLNFYSTLTINCLALNRPLHTPSDDQNYSETSIQHFHDKLLKICDRLKTNPGKQMGAKRHQFVSFSPTVSEGCLAKIQLVKVTRLPLRRGQRVQWKLEIDITNSDVSRYLLSTSPKIVDVSRRDEPKLRLRCHGLFMSWNRTAEM